MRKLPKSPTTFLGGHHLNIGNPCARMQRWKTASSTFSAYIVALMLAGCSGDTHLSFLDPQGPVAAAQRWHFAEALAVLVVFVAIRVFVLTPWFLWRYRYGATSSRYTPKWDFYGPLEIASWAGPVGWSGISGGW